MGMYLCSGLVAFFIGEFSPNFDLENMISTSASDQYTGTKQGTKSHPIFPNQSFTPSFGFAWICMTYFTPSLFCSYPSLNQALICSNQSFFTPSFGSCKSSELIIPGFMNGCCAEGWFPWDLLSLVVKHSFAPRGSRLWNSCSVVVVGQQHGCKLWLICMLLLLDNNMVAIFDWLAVVDSVLEA